MSKSLGADELGSLYGPPKPVSISSQYESIEVSLDSPSGGAAKQRVHVHVATLLPAGRPAVTVAAATVSRRCHLPEAIAPHEATVRRHQEPEPDQASNRLDDANPLSAAGLYDRIRKNQCHFEIEN